MAVIKKFQLIVKGLDHIREFCVPFLLQRKETVR